MIPKSIIELTINVFYNDLKELENINNREISRGANGYGEVDYIQVVRRNIDTYKMLIKEYEKYLEENYGDSSNLKIYGVGVNTDAGAIIDGKFVPTRPPKPIPLKSKELNY
jgi:hypothetical protein